MRNLLCLVAAMCAAALMLSGCATIVEGTSQRLNMNIAPRTATCTAVRDGVIAGVYDAATQTMDVDKSRHDLTVTCSAPGYQTRTVRLVSNASGWGIIGVGFDLGITDYATGALNKYDDTITIVLDRS